MNNAAEFLTRLELNSFETILLKIKKDFPTKPIKVNTDSTRIPQEEPVFFKIKVLHETTENEFLKSEEET